jgi:hypothetical protein
MILWDVDSANSFAGGVELSHKNHLFANGT